MHTPLTTATIATGTSNSTMSLSPTSQNVQTKVVVAGAGTAVVGAGGGTGAVAVTIGTSSVGSGSSVCVSTGTGTGGSVATGTGGSSGSGTVGGSGTSNSGGGGSGGGEAHTQILSRPRLQDLVREVDATEQLDEEVEELLLQLADDFVESTVNAACTFAKHRHANTVDIKDVQLHLERNWNMSIPGFGTDELKPYKRSTVTEAHKQRMALIRKALKKY